jgi:primosomal protein N' (replication factor Y)
MSILRIAVPAPFREPLDYLPAADGPVPPVGARVVVPLGRRLRRAGRALDETPFLPPDLLALARWTADYYQHPIGEVLAQMLPVAARRTDGTERGPNGWRRTAAAADRDADALARAPARRRALALLDAAPEGLTTAALAEAGVRPEILRALAADGWVEKVRIEEPAPTVDAVPPQPPPILGDEQAAAAARLRDALGGFGAFLLEGVTGSGKTEVYFDAMRAALDAGRQALLLVPEIGLTPQTLTRLRARFPEPLAVLHSGLGDGARLAAWRAAAAGRARIVVGTRSAIFAPLPEAGVVVVDEEHDESYKQQDGLRYSARDLAVKRARDLDVPVILGSATPSLESLRNALDGRYGHLRLSRRAGGARPPAARVVDVNRHPVEEGLSTPLLDAVRERIARDEQVMVFLNRRGFAPVLMCQGCRWIAECPRCDARLTVHARQGSLRCHHCGTRRPLPSTCPACGEPEPMPVGVGTQRTESALARHFPDVRIIRIDRDSTRSAAALTSTFDAIAEAGPAILVGTQMITKGHHFPDVTLVAVIDADGGLFSADFRAGERLAQQLVQVAGRAGRAARPGEVLIQTRQPDHPLLRALLDDGYPAFAASALVEREALGFPPYGRLALLRAEATDARAPDAFLEAAAARLREHAGAVQVLGPVPATMVRRAGRHRARLLLQAGDRASLHRLLRATVPTLDGLPEARRVRWSLDVDPLDTL